VTGALQTARVENQRMRVLSAPVEVGTVQLALPLDQFEELRDDFVWTMAFGMPILFCVASIGGFWMSGRALKPVDEIADAAKRISARNLSERLPSVGTGDELDRLSGVLNEMLAGLEAAFRRITQFTADASHELRTPVAIIRTTAEVIRARTRTIEEHQQAWESVLRQTERTSQLLDDLLTLARADSGSDAFHFESIDLDGVVRDACTEIQLVAESKNLKISTGPLPECLVLADREALRRAFLILLDNAIKATPDGGAIQVSVTIDEEFEPKMIFISFKDTGTGVGSEDLPYIFDRFYRAQQDRSRRTGGAGLGLSIALWIVTRHGGTINVESAVGVGSTFCVQLPMQSSVLTTPAVLYNPQPR
jgi:signal transduction histidine kinase